MSSSRIFSTEKSFGKDSPYVINMQFGRTPPDINDLLLFSNYQSQIQQLKQTLHSTKQSKKWDNNPQESVNYATSAYNLLPRVTASSTNRSISITPITLTEGEILANALSDGINILLKNTPALSILLTPFQNDLAIIKLKLPNISDHDLIILQTMALTIYTALPKSIDKNTRSKFLEKILNAFQVDYQLYQNNMSNAALAIQIEEQALSNYEQAVALVHEMISQIITISSNPSDETPISLFLKGNNIIHSFTNLSLLLPNLSNQEFIAINNLINDVLNLGWLTTSPVATIPMLYLIKNNIIEYMQDDPQTPPATIISDIEESLILSFQRHPSKTALIKALNYIIHTKGITKFINTTTPIPTFDLQVFINELPAYLDLATTAALNTPNNIKSILADWKISDEDVLLLASKNKITALKTTSNTISTNADYLNDIINNLEEEFLKCSSIGNSFNNMILNNYVPAETALFQPLTQSLIKNNFGANFINGLLANISGFGSSSAYYQFHTSLVYSLTSGDFSGSASQACDNIIAEISQVNTNLAQVKQTQQYLDQQKQRVTSDLTMSDADKSDFMSLITLEKNQLNTIYQQLLDLSSLLSVIKPSPITNPDGSPSNTFRITGPTNWSKLLTQLESQVVNGNSESIISGGLGTFATDTISQHQTFSSHQQVQLITLQNKMTTMQQQWSIVSSSLQTLEQLYATLLIGIL